MSNTATQPVRVDVNFVRQLAAANGLELSPERAESLVSAVQAMVDADAELRELDLDNLTVIGLPWDGEAA